MKSNRKIQYLASICVSLTFVFNGAVLSWGSPVIPKIQSGEEDLEITDTQASWIISMLNLGAFPGSYIGQILTERFGRRTTIYISMFPGLLGGSIVIFTRSPWLMILSRFLMGINIGITAVVSLIYITEIADKEIRGGLGMLVQVMLNLGGLLMYGIGPFVSYTTLNVIVLSLPLVAFGTCLWIPESPYYHLKDGRLEEARKAFVVLKGNRDEKIINDELNVIKAHVRESMEERTTFKELMTNLRYRKSVYIVIGIVVGLVYSGVCAVLGLKIIQYMTGSMAIQSYLETIFRQGSSISGPLVSIIYGCLQLTVGIATAFLSNWFGSRIRLLTSCLGVALSLTSVGIYFYLQVSFLASKETLYRISFLPLAGILGFNITYAIGLGSVTTVMQAELFPINVKTVAAGSASMFACILCFIVAKSYQNIKDFLGHHIVFWSFATVAYLGLIFVYYLVPETSGKTLEEVQDNMDSVKLSELQALKGKPVE